jgi:subfamily B ATP-binding cassette protein HlyB/CyaB
MANPTATMDEIVNSAKIAGANDFISELSEGYDTEVGERGASLSGGQKQRIAIARALLTNPRILIFDEATSALDYESEKIINQNIEKITEGRTTLIIAHRLSTVRKCDVIIAMDKGQIVEAGTHEQLIAKKGYYYHLYTQQEA